MSETHGGCSGSKEASKSSEDGSTPSPAASIPGADELLALWPRLLLANDVTERARLIIDSICAASKVVASVHEARGVAARLVRYVDRVDDDTETAERWREEGYGK